MRILIIAPQPFYTDRGTPMNVKLMCKVLGEADHSVDLLVFPTGKDVALSNVHIIRLKNIFGADTIPAGPSLIKLAYDVVLSGYTLWLCLTRKYDVVHGIEEGGFLAVLFGNLLRKKSVFDMDSCISEQLAYSGFIKQPFLLQCARFIEKTAMKRSSLILTVCSSLTAKAKKIAPKASVVQIEDIPITNVQSSDDMQEIPLRIIEGFQLAEGRKVVYTGNLEKYQGIDLLLETWHFLHSQSHITADVKLVIVGGPQEKVDYYKKLTAAYEERDSVCWIGPRPAGEMQAWMQLSDVLVSPRSQGDNTPLKIYSYMDSGCPVVATDRKTHTQVLDESMAFLANPEPEQFAQAILEALFNEKLVDEKTRQAKKTVQEKYCYSVFQQKLLNAYDAIES